MKRSERGFTLLEVMAAVAVVAIVFTTLSGVANQGLHSEGTSRRRFEASLLADEALAAFLDEIGETGEAEAGSTEYEDGIFLVTRLVTTLDIHQTFPPSQGEASEELGLLPADDAPQQPILANMVQIIVSWPEGLEEQEVVRTTFAVAPEGAEAGAPGAEAAPQTPGAGDTTL